MIEINGSYGEGGGALLRVSTALSSLTGKAFTIQNIRSNRPKPGLMPQHLNAALTLGKISSAKVEGLELGSTKMTFTPGQLTGGKLEVDVQTAGSITLILQALMIPSIFTDQGVEIKIKGGTDVRWAPSVDYMEQVTLPLMQAMGISIDLELIQRGYYPRGGGVLKACIEPVKKMKPLKLHELEVDVIKGISYSSKLPLHVSRRQVSAAEETIRNAGYEAEIEIKTDDNTLSQGSGLVLWSEVKGRKVPCVGASSLGKPGKRAEIVGREAACEILSFISRGAALDKYMGDQIIPYLALAGSSSVRTSHLTQHTLTNIYATEKFTGKKFHIDGGLGEVTTLTVE
jgi:RNA 3'-terminal phosphate cyclase (ATP)